MASLRAPTPTAPLGAPLSPSRLASPCFWAFPENYTHVALEEVRRLDLEWRADEVAAFDRLKARAEQQGLTVQALVKHLLEG